MRPNQHPTLVLWVSRIAFVILICLASIGLTVDTSPAGASTPAPASWTLTSPVDFQSGVRVGADAYQTPGSLGLLIPNDDFDRPTLNPDRWTFSGYGAHIDLSDGAVRIATSQPGRHGVGSINIVGYPLTGDAITTVEFKLVEWHGSSFNTQAHFTLADAASNYVEIKREGHFHWTGHTDGYVSAYGGPGWYNFFGPVLDRGDLIGALRLSRTEGVVSTYYLRDGGFAPLGSVRWNSKLARPSLSAWNNDSMPGFDVRFDNFRIASNQGVVNPVYVPSGTFQPPTYDAGPAPYFGAILWDPPLQPAKTSVSFWIATSDDKNGLVFLGPDGTNATAYTFSGQGVWPAASGHRYLAYIMALQTADLFASPRVDEVVVLHTPYLSFPWTSGVAWQLTGGPHPSTGSTVRDALDFAPCSEDRTVRAAAGGTVKRADAGAGILTIEHEGGWTTLYGHLASIAVSAGTEVSAGQAVAEAGMTDASSVHLHFALQREGAWASLSGGDVFLGGWRIHAGAADYQGSLTRSGVETAAASLGCEFSENRVSDYFSQNLDETHRLVATPGQELSVTLHMGNSGAVSWAHTDQVRLGLLTWNDAMGAAPRAGLEPGEQVAAGNERDWTIHLIAPQAPGEYWQEWRMVREDGKVGWFGQRARIEVLVPREVTSSVVGPAGGSVSSLSGDVKATLAPGALDSETTIAYRSLTALPVGDRTGPGVFFDLSAVDSQGRSITYLDPGVRYTLSVTYAPAPTGADANLVLYYQDGEEWVREWSSQTEQAGRTVIAQPSRFGRWALLADATRIHLPQVAR